MKILLTFIFLFILVIINACSSGLTHRDYSTYKKEISGRYNYNNTSDPDHYLVDCSDETKKGIKFPITEPAYAVLHYDKIGKGDKTLSAAQIRNLIILLNDTASYECGEVGTPYFDRFITFHDKTNLCIGVTEISYDGQTYSTPSIAKMKWGALKGENLNKIIKILEEE